MNKFMQMNSHGSEKKVSIDFQKKKYFGKTHLNEFGKVNLNEPWKVRFYLEKMYELESMAGLYVLL